MEKEVTDKFDQTNVIPVCRQHQGSHSPWKSHWRWPQPWKVLKSKSLKSSLNFVMISQKCFLWYPAVSYFCGLWNSDDHGLSVLSLKIESPQNHICALRCQLRQGCKYESGDLNVLESGIHCHLFVSSLPFSWTEIWIMQQHFCLSPTADIDKRKKMRQKKVQEDRRMSRRIQREEERKLGLGKFLRTPPLEIMKSWWK